MFGHININGLTQARLKRTRSVGVTISGAKSTELRSTGQLSRSLEWREGMGKCLMCVNTEKVLEMDNGGSCPTLWMNLRLMYRPFKDGQNVWHQPLVRPVEALQDEKPHHSL